MGEISNSAGRSPAMELPDRLNLLSLVAVIWLAAAVLLGAAIAIGIAASGSSDDSSTPDESFAFIWIWVAVVAAPAWLCSWGFVTLAMFGSRTTLRGGQLRTSLRDVAVAFAGTVLWTAAAFFLGLQAFQVVLGVLAVAVSVGAGAKVWRLLFRRGSGAPPP